MPRLDDIKYLAEKKINPVPPSWPLVYHLIITHDSPGNGNPGACVAASGEASIFSYARDSFAPMYFSTIGGDRRLKICTGYGVRGLRTTDAEKAFMHIREGIDYHLQNLMERIINKMWAVRSVSKKQYRPEKPEHSQLKTYQKIWLCDEYRQSREEKNDWLDKLCEEIANWIIHRYEKLLNKQAFKLDDEVLKKIHRIVIENKEALR